MRLAGCAVLLTAALWIGAVYAMESKRKLVLMMTFTDSLTVLQNEVCSRQMPLPEALERCAASFSATRPFYQMLLFGMSLEQPFSETWRCAVEQFLHFSAEDCQTVLALGQQLGCYDARTMETAFSSCVAILRMRLPQLRAVIATNARLAVGCSAACGLLLAVICY